MHTPVIIEAPPSKSLSHRFLLAAALARGNSRLNHVLESDDTARTREVLSSLGANFTRLEAGVYEVQGIAGKVTSTLAESGQPLSCFVGESGTTCRLLTAVLAAGRGLFRVHGAGRMHQRPMGELISALQILGARFTFEGQEQYPPFTLDTRATRTLETGARTRYEELPLVDLGSDESSQYLSGLLLSAPLYPQGLIIRLSGRKAVSWPYIGLTLDTMERFGLDFSVQETAADDGQIILAADWRSIKEAVPGRLRFLVRPGIYQAGVHTVEGDWSGASYFLAAGAIGPVPVRVNGLNPASLQGDAAILPILEGMGARIERGENCITVFPGPLRGIRVSMAHCPDLAPTVAAVAAHALGETRIEDAAHLKIKESDRLAAPARELAKAGCSVQVTADGLIVEPPQKGLKPPADGTIFQTHGDHRIAMALSLLGLPGVRHNPGFAVRLDNPGCVAKSFPNFWELWEKVHSHSRGKADIVAGE